jgi:hypothetical protein
MNNVSDIKLKNLLQDYRGERAALLGPERDRLYTLIQERYSADPATAKALITVFNDEEIRSQMLAPTAKLTMTWIADKARAAESSSPSDPIRLMDPEMIRRAILTWADALGMKYVEVRTPEQPAKTLVQVQPKPNKPPATTDGPQANDWRIVLSLAAIAIGLFLTGGEALNAFFGKPTVDGYYATQALLAHPIQYLADRPLSVLGSLFFTGGLVSLFNR